MMQFENAETYIDWRAAARRLIAGKIAPEHVQWTDGVNQPSLFEQATLFAENEPAEQPTHVTPDGSATPLTVPKSFLEIAENVACHRSPLRWQLLYRTLWRIVNEQRHLLEITTDQDVHELTRMQKAVARDAHKMKAFVRFRKVVAVDGVENYIAWHRPDHRIVGKVAPFFSRRFKGMNWSILTPDQSVSWDQTKLHFGPGVPASEAPDEDVLEELWKTYYASIFNPARLKVQTMKREMPVRHWATLPEATLIDDLIAGAPRRVETMIEQNEGFAETATHYMPERLDLAALQAAAACCQACDLHQHATQTVFGVGPADARIVLIGEQPGDREDIEGRPFIGPAGQLLSEALSLAGVQRSEVYVTNVVKHFKFEMKSSSTDPEMSLPPKRRLHKKPNSREIYACRPWLEAELAAIAPDVIVCLGATPAQALFGRDFRITQDRGKILPTDWCPRTLATWHPAAILRMPDASRRDQMQQQLVSDLKLIQGTERP